MLGFVLAHWLYVYTVCGPWFLSPVSLPAHQIRRFVSGLSTYSNVNTSVAILDAWSKVM